jgi:hypothetical protein
MTASQQEQGTALLITSILRNLGNKTWLSGVSDVVEAMDDPQRNAGRLVSRLAGSMAVPAIIGQTTRIIDPVQREIREPSTGSTGTPLLDRALGGIQSRVPGLSSRLPAKRDVFGEEVRTEGGVGPDLGSPIWTKQAKNDPVVAELIQVMAKVGRPSRRLQRRRLTAAEYDSYQRLSGRYMTEDLDDLIAGRAWSRMGPDEKIAAVDKIKRDARSDARADLGLDAPPPPPGFELAAQ